MNKLISVFLCLLLLVSILVAQSTFDIKNAAALVKNSGVTQSDLTGLGLPKIAGQWYFVDGKDGVDTRNGRTPAAALLTVSAAYTKCTTGHGDGIVLLSRSISGTSYSNSETRRLIWAKHGITLIGIASPNVYYGRARWIHASAADSLCALLLVTGSNNTFINIDFYNNPENDGSPIYGSTRVSAVQVSGPRNSFIGCHFNCVPQTAYSNKLCDLWLRTGSDECRYIDCFFGSSSYAIGDSAASWIYLDGAAAQNFFKNCTFVQQVSAGNTFGAIRLGATTALNGVDIFEECSFAIWRANTSSYQLCSYWHTGSDPNTGAIGMRNCLVLGFQALSSTGDRVFTNLPAANAAGGIAVTP